MSLSKPTILPIGTLGTGKSTFMNCCLGSYGFKTSDSTEGCTQKFESKETDVMTLIDAPGLADPRMPIGDWVNSLKKIGGTKVSLCLLLIMQKVRPDAQDKMNILVMLEAVKELNPDNVAVVFTHCDENRSFTKAKGLLFLNSLLDSLRQAQHKVPFQVTTERIFLFKGSETSQREAYLWLSGIIPAVSCKVNSAADATKIILQASGDETTKAFMEKQKRENEAKRAQIQSLSSQVSSLQSTVSSYQAYSPPRVEYRSGPPPKRRNRNRNRKRRHSPCFAKGTTLFKVIGEVTIKTCIEDIQENDYVLAQHSDGQIRPELVVVKDAHIDESDVLTFILSNGQQISVTGNHGMLVYQDGDLRTATSRSQLVYARDVQIGMKFRHVTMTKSAEAKSTALHSSSYFHSIELVTVTDIKHGSSASVYNVAGYNFNVVADNIVVSSHGEATKDVPEIVFKAGQFIYDWVGVKASRAYYRAMDNFA